ncbi:MAG: hypothetical protein H7837_07515 [Magnetococcus sp. MYC-9]
MVDEKGSTRGLQNGEYLLSDPVLLQEMRTAREVRLPGSSALLVSCYAPITEKLIAQLRARGIETLFAEPIQGKSVLASVAYMENMFQVIDQIVRKSLGNVQDLATSFQHRRDQQTLERLMRENLADIQDLFLSDPTEKLLALTRYHNGTARHSIVASFHMMAIGRELGWSDAQIVKAAVAVFNHDIGKTKVSLATLDWPGRLNNEQWKEIQYHPLRGGLLFHRAGETPDLLMLVALMHHEWYAAVPGKGYGGATLFADYLKQSVQVDMPSVLAQITPQDREILHASSLVDMVSALEERRSYKQELDPIKVIIIMNSDAVLGHFDPGHYAAWHRIYLRQNPNLLPLGRRVALPREKEQRLFVPKPPKMVNALPLLTYYELVQLGILPVLKNVGMDVERIRRRGGLLLKVVEQMKEEKRLSFDCSPAALEAAGITLLKDRIIPEEEMIELDAWREWLTYEELERSELLSLVRSHHFDLGIIRREGGIAPYRLSRRGVRIPEQKLRRLGIELLKRWTVRLPASENRLTAEELGKLGIGEARIKEAGCLEKVKRLKSVPLQWLEECGLAISSTEMARCNIDPVRKVFYDILVTQEISSTRAQFVILREGDPYEGMEAAREKGDLDPVQDLLLNKIGPVVMDFSELVAMPDLSHVRMGSHWGVSETEHL